MKNAQTAMIYLLPGLNAIRKVMDEKHLASVYTVKHHKCLMQPRGVIMKMLDF